MSGSVHGGPGRARRWVRPAMAGLVLAVVAAAGWLIWQRSDSRAAEPSLAGPALAQVQRTRLDGAVAATLSVQVEQGTKLLASGGGTWVSDVAVAADDTVEEGDAVYALDGIPVIAAATDFPLGRELDVGSTGPDVAQLEAFLARRGSFDGTVDDRFTAVTGRAVDDLGHDLGVGHTSTFNPAWLAFVPADPTVVGEVLLDPATPAPAVGTAWARQPDRIASTTVRMPPDWQPSGAGQAYVLAAGKVTLDARVTSDGLQLRDGQQARLRELVAQQPSTGTAGTQPTAGAEGGAPSGTAPTEISMTARPVDPVAAIVVPVSALVTDNDGAPCVAVVTGDAPQRPDWTRVAVIGSQPGIGAYLAGDALSEDQQLVLNPDPPAGLLCG